jgi:hypothetical protein
MSPENTFAIQIMAGALQTSPEMFLDDLVFWHCQREIESRGLEYLAETIHGWIFPTQEAARRAAEKFEELAVAGNLEGKPGWQFSTRAK